MFSIILAVSIIVLFVPSVKIAPSVITTAYSSYSDELNGYGLRLQSERISLAYYRMIHSYRIPEKLERPGGIVVYSGIANLWEFNYDIWQRENYKIGVGINKIRNKEIGWQIFGKASIDDFVIIQLGLKQIHIARETILLTAGFSLNF